MSKYHFSPEPKIVELVNTKNRIIATAIPCPGTKEVLENLEIFESRSMHGQLPLVWEKAKDFNIYDSSGNKWIDFTSTIFVANIGHANQHLISSIEKMFEKNLLATYAYPSRIRSEYLKKLVEFAGPNFQKAFLLSAGTEATEAAVKLMKMRGRILKKKKNIVLSLSGNWHGRTMGAQLLSSNVSQKDWINTLSAESVQSPFPYPWEVSEENGAQFAIDSFAALIEQGISPKDDICGVMLETFQGWAAAFYPKSYVQEISRICIENDILLCFDEMQSGFGRTGKNFGYEHYGVKADLICCGKGMGGGFPVSGVIGSAEVMDLPEVGNMSSTHSGNPIMAAAGLAVLEEIENLNLISESARKGKILHDQLHILRNQFPKFISSIQGIGLIAAVIFDKNSHSQIEEIVSKIAEDCMQKGLLVVHTGRESIKIGPPLTISDEALIEGLQVLKESIEVILTGEIKLQMDAK